MGLAESIALSLLSYGMLGVFVLAALESFVFPIPTAFIVMISTSFGMEPLAVVIVATLGSVTGAGVGYLIGLRGGRPILERFGKRSLSHVDRMFEKYGVYAIGIAALSPLPYKAFTIAAGVARMNFPAFLLVSLPCRFLQFLIFAVFGDVVHELIF